jgi:hypothetical protein
MISWEGKSPDIMVVDVVTSILSILGENFIMEMVQYGENARYSLFSNILHLGTSSINS